MEFQTRRQGFYGVEVGARMTVLRLEQGVLLWSPIDAPVDGDVRWLKRDVARRELGDLLELDFDRLVCSHGHVLERGGKQALRGAFRWLGL